MYKGPFVTGNKVNQSKLKVLTLVYFNCHISVKTLVCLISLNFIANFTSLNYSNTSQYIWSKTN